MVIVVFESRLRSENSDEFHELGERMLELAREIPGFLSYDVYKSEDCARASIIKFESIEACDAWRSHPEHMAAQQRGRDHFYTDYRLYVTECLRETHFER